MERPFPPPVEIDDSSPRALAVQFIAGLLVSSPIQLLFVHVCPRSAEGHSICERKRPRSLAHFDVGAAA